MGNKIIAKYPENFTGFDYSDAPAMAALFESLEMTSLTGSLEKTMTEKEKADLKASEAKKKREREDKKKRDYAAVSNTIATLGIDKRSSRSKATTTASASASEESGLTDDMEELELAASLPSLPHASTLLQKQKTMFFQYVQYLQDLLTKNRIAFASTPPELLPQRFGQ